MLGALSRAMRNRFYFDEFYEATVIKLNDRISALADAFDRWVVADLACAEFTERWKYSAGRYGWCRRELADILLPVRSRSGSGALVCAREMKT